MTKVIEPSGLFYPNRIARYVLLATQDVIGRNGLNAILGLAKLDALIDSLPPDNLDKEFDFAALSALTLALEEMYGVRGGRGMALRIGRACFAAGFKHFGALRGMGDPAFVALPLESRIKIAVPAFASIFTKFTDQISSVLDDGDALEFVANPSPFAWGRVDDRPVCHTLSGILQEGMRWASNGHEFHVQEVACKARGDATCVFRINKTPIGQYIRS
jgi:predicted hydrocarbon binding protein